MFIAQGSFRSINKMTRSQLQSTLPQFTSHTQLCTTAQTLTEALIVDNKVAAQRSAELGHERVGALAGTRRPRIPTANVRGRCRMRQLRVCFAFEAVYSLQMKAHLLCIGQLRTAYGWHSPQAPFCGTQAPALFARLPTLDFPWRFVASLRT